MDNSSVDHEPKDHQPPPESGSLFLWCVLCVAISFFLGISLTLRQAPQMQTQFQPEHKQKSLADEARELGTPTDRFDGLLSRIKNDINKNDVDVKVLIGPYFKYYLINGLLVSPDPFSPDKTYPILLDDIFLSKLNPKEQEAVVAHEAGHLLFRPAGLNLKDIIEAQVRADTFALKYVDPKDFLSFLDKLYEEYTTRRKNIEELTKSR